MRPRSEHDGVGGQVGVAAHPSLPQPFKWHRTEPNPFGSHSCSRRAQSPSYQALWAFFLPWIAPLPPSGWGKLGSPFQAPAAGTDPSASAGLVQAGSCRAGSSRQWLRATAGPGLRHLHGFAFQLSEVFIARSLKARDRQSLRKNAEGVSGPRGPWPGVVCLCEL